jgi:hypothetical protein
MATPYTSTQYRLRAGSPMPVGTDAKNFVWHTFMAEVNDIDIYDCYTDRLPGSEEFRGQGGEKAYISAQFTRVGVAGGDVFTGRIVYSPSYVDEDALGFNY